MLSRTTAEDLIKMASDLRMDWFQGVYSMDTLPDTIEKRNTLFITNTDSSNLPGTHWIAVVIRDGRGYCFDPLGYPPPTWLGKWMSTHVEKWSSNSRQVQTYFTHLCGHFCIHFLYHCTLLNFEDTPHVIILNQLYPVKYDKNIYEHIIMNFFKLYHSKK
jgi:hypothetical protein